MENEFVPYKVALALKELGFDEPCFAGYLIDTKELWIGYVESQGGEQFNKEYHISAPTFSQAFRWFREKYDLSFYIWKKEDLFKLVLQRPFKNSYFFNDEFKTYEEAELECLRILIEIVKKKEKNK